MFLFFFSLFAIFLQFGVRARRLLLRAAFFLVYMVWIAFAGVITFLVSFYYFCAGFITFLVNYCICGLAVKIYTMLLIPWPYLSNCYSPTDVLTKITSLIKHHALTITHLHPHPPHLHKLAKHAIAVNANLVHFLSHSNHSHTDMQLIPLENIRSSRDSVRKARESHLIDKAMTLEPHGLNRRDELL